MSFNRILKLAEIVADSGDIELFKSLSTYIDSYIKKVSHMEPKNDGTTPNPWKRNMDYSPEENSPYFGSVSEFMKKFPGGIKDWVKWRNKTKKNRYKKYDMKTRKACLEIIMKKAEDNKLREELANLEHEQWAHWTKYMLNNLTDENKEKWEKQIKTNYKKLSEKEKDSDREWADKVLKIVKKYSNIKKAHFEPVGPDDTKNFPKEPHLYSGDGLDKFKSIKEFIEKTRKNEQNAEDATKNAIKDMIEYWKTLQKDKK